jgi:hypothetical protein
MSGLLHLDPLSSYIILLTCFMLEYDLYSRRVLIVCFLGYLTILYQLTKPNENSMTSEKVHCKGYGRKLLWFVLVFYPSIRLDGFDRIHKISQWRQPNSNQRPSECKDHINLFSAFTVMTQVSHDLLSFLTHNVWERTDQPAHLKGASRLYQFFQATSNRVFFYSVPISTDKFTVFMGISSFFKLHHLLRLCSVV